VPLVRHLVSVSTKVAPQSQRRLSGFPAQAVFPNQQKPPRGEAL
jgi:hypothetical protein